MCISGITAPKKQTVITIALSPVPPARTNRRWAWAIASHLASSPHSPPIQTNLLLDFRGKSTNIHSIESSPLYVGKREGGAESERASDGGPLKMIVSFSLGASGGLYPNLA